MPGNPKHKPLKKILFWILIYILFPLPGAFAGYITMETTVETTLTGDELKVAVKLTNKGDEPAFNVIADVEAGGNSRSGTRKKRLESNETFVTALDFKLFYARPGSYPVIVRADFADANGYPFSSVSITHITFKEAIYPKVFAKMEPLSMVKNGTARLRLKNLDSTETVVTVKLVLPKELSAEEHVKTFVLPESREKDAEFEITNFSALVGARQPIFAVVSYDKNGKHCSTSATANVTILEKRKLTVTESALLIGLPLAALVIFAFYILLRKRKKE